MKTIQQLGWLIILLSALTASICTGWFALAKVDYGFFGWYDFYEIEAHIDKYGPQNRYKHGLEQSPPAEHIRLFGEISHAIHNHGEGLADIEYQHRGRPIKLLRKPEVVHLQDVANLIDQLRIAAIASGLIAVLGTPLLLKFCSPAWKVQGILLTLLITGSLAAIMAIGPLDVFYYLHVKIFPEDHEWFFYYQDSLMATVMKAPVVFGGIAGAITTSGLLVFIGYLIVLKYLNRWFTDRRSGVIL